MTVSQFPKFLLIYCIVFSSQLFAQNYNEVVASAGKEKITVKDFLFRYELSPFITHKSGGDPYEQKQDFLYSILAEKLWYLEAREKGIESSDLFQFYYKPIEDIHLRDALFKLEVLDKVKLSAQEVSDAISIAGITLKTLVVSSHDSSLISRIAADLHSVPAEKHDSILGQYISLEVTLNPFIIVPGTLRDAETEQYLFHLNGVVTKPIRSEMGWTLFIIKEKSSSPVDITDKKTTDGIKEIVKNRKIFERAGQYMQQLLGSSIIAIDETAFRIAAQAAAERVAVGFPTSADTTQNKYILSDSDFKLILSELSTEQSSAVLFSIGKENFTVRSFLAQIAFDEPLFTTPKREYVFAKLNTLAKNFVQNQVLTLEAKKRGLNNLPAVQSDLAKWKESLLAQILKISYLDSARISDVELDSYINNDMAADKDLIYINLRLLTLPRLTEIEDVLRKLSAGTSFEQLTLQYGKTDPLVNDSGVTGLMPVAALGNIGTIAANLPLNDLYGPVKRDDGYSLFMVTERRSNSDSLPADIQKQKEQVRSFLMQRKLNSVISGHTLKLAAKYSAVINEKVFSGIKTTGIHMFTHRLMGFGGKIAAIPLLDNWADWIDIPQFRQVLLP